MIKSIVKQFYVVVVLKKDIFIAQIPVDDIILVQFIHTHNNLISNFYYIIQIK